MVKLGTVSPDPLIKLALVAGAIGLAYYAYKQASGAAGAVARQLGEVADAVIVGTNPANPENYVNRAVSAVGSAIVSDTGPGRNADNSWTVGAWAYDVLHPGWSTDAIAGTSPGAAPIQADYSQLANLGAP